MTRSIASVLVATAAIALGACGSDTEPVGHLAPLRVVAGAGVTDTIQARLTSALIVEVHDSGGGSGSGRVVRFESLPPDDTTRRTETAVSVTGLASNTFTTFLSTTADSSGRAAVLVALGTVAGTARLRVSVPEFGLVDTVTFGVLPGATSKLKIGTRDTTVQPGATYDLHVAGTDRFGNAVASEPLTFSFDAGIASVSSAGRVTVGTALARASIAISWKNGADTAHVSILPRLALVGDHLTTARFVVLVNTDGTGYTELASSGDASLSPSSVKSTPAVVYYTGSPGFNAILWIVTPNTAVHTLVPTSMGLASAQWPRLSPDGQWVYFVGSRAQFGVTVLWRIRPDGTQADSIGLATTSGSFPAPAVSPDGRTVALPDVNGIKLIDVASKSAQIIHPALPCLQPRYSPDGARFACISSGALTVMNVDGTAARQLNSTASFNTQYDDLSGVDWSPDGSWLIARSQGLGPQLVSVADGTAFNLASLGPLFTQLSFVR